MFGKGEEEDSTLTRKNDNIPSKSDAIDILNKLGLQRHIISHVLAVSRKAIKIASKIQSVPIDLKLVRIGAILHDIGRTQTHDFLHGVAGGKIIREQLHWSERLARIAETHILGGLTKEEAIELGLPPNDYMPVTLEEKIVCLADKYINGSKEVPIDHRFRNWFNRFGETELLIKSKKRVEQLELEIYRLMYP
jgi:uncharacterized protein